MKIFNKYELTLREFIYLILILLLTIGFFLQTYAAQKTIVEYNNAYTKCLYNLELSKNGISGYSILPNGTMNLNITIT